MPSLQRAGGLKFNIGNGIDCGSGQSFKNTQISAELLLKASDLNYQMPMCMYDSTSIQNGTTGWAFKFRANGAIWFRIGTEATNVDASVSSGYSPNQILHVIGTYDGSSIKVYINGMLSVVQPCSLILNTSTLAHVSIGRNFTGLSENFSGIIYTARVYNRALSPSEVYNNFQGQVIRDASLVGEWLLNATSGTTATDTSGNGNHGTLNGGQWVNKPAGTLRPRTAPLKPAPPKRAIKYNGQDGYSFSRPSVEPYNGMTVPMDSPRVDNNGLMVEEGTSNIYLNVGTRLYGTPQYTEITSDGWYKQTNASGVGTSATMGSRFVVPLSNLANGQTYACSAIAYNPQSYPIQVHQDWCDNYDNVTTFNLITIQPFETKRISVTGVKATYDATYRFYDVAVQGIGNSIWIKQNSIQVEAKAYPTSFTDNPLGRQPETLTFAVGNVLNASAGTIEVWAYEDGLVTGVNNFFYDSDGASRFLLNKNQAASKYDVAFSGITGIANIPLPSKGFHLYSVKWNGISYDFFIDGVKQGSYTSSVTFSGVTTMYIGSRFSGVGQRNNPIKSLRISNVARSDQEILDSYNASKVSNKLSFDDKTTKLLNFVA